MKKKGLFVTGVVAVVAAVGVWIFLVGSYYPTESVAGLTVVTASDGTNALFVTESVSHRNADAAGDTRYTTRLAVYDLTTGERRSRRVIQRLRPNDSSLTWLGNASKGAWFHSSKEGVQLLDPHDGAVLRSEKDLFSSSQRQQLLRSGYMDRRIGNSDGSLFVTLEDGRRLRITQDSKEGVVYPKPLPMLIPPRKPSSSTQTIDGQLWQLPRTLGDHRSHLKGPTMVSEQTYLRAVFLLSSTPHPLVESSANAVLILHQTSLKKGSQSSLSLVHMVDGTAKWTTPVGVVDRIHVAAPIPEGVSLAFVNQGTTRLLAVELDSGDIRYDYNLD